MASKVASVKRQDVIERARARDVLASRTNVGDAVSNALAQMKSSMRGVRVVLASSLLREDARDGNEDGRAFSHGDGKEYSSAATGFVGLVGAGIAELSGNHVFMAAFYAWGSAQLMKYFTTFYREGKWDWRVMFDSGGMPSSHSSLVVGLTTAVAYGYGLGSALFPVSLAFSLIVMYDAAGVRRHAGKQAEVLNRILEGMVKGDVSEKKLKEVLGHSPLQVFAGSFLGVLIGIMYMYKYAGGYACLA